MGDARVLIVYYSRTGTTAQIAEDVDRALRYRGVFSDLELLEEARDRAGVPGYLGSTIASVLDRRTELLPLDCDPSQYALVVVGTPIWNAHVSTPVRTFLSTWAPRMPCVAWFFSHDGAGQADATTRMVRLVGKAPVATLAVRERELSPAGHARAIKLFADRIAAALQPRNTRSAVRI
jgi:hypothetical protein